VGTRFFLDAWLDNLPLDFCAIPLEEKWVVTASVHESLKPGEVMTDVNEATVEAFFLRHRRYISASSAAAQRRNLFLYPYLFPQHFTLTLEDGREVAIDRAASRRIAARTEGRWVETNRVAFIKIPTFLDPTSESTALDYVRRFHRAQILIVDLKNNSGGIPPQRLIRAMMNQPFRGWSEVCLTYQNCPETPQKPRSGGSAKPDPSAFRGRVILLVDGGCVSACEDFVEPFKETGRGTLVGETTQGSSGVPFVYDFHNGMTLRIAVKRNYFSDGTEFEGIGIKPDIEVHATIEDLKKGRDPVLQKALELAEYPLR